MDDFQTEPTSKAAVGFDSELRASLSKPPHVPAIRTTAVQRDLSFVDKRILARLQRYNFCDRILFQDRFIIGRGSFSDVFKGICVDAKQNKVDVAMKRLRLHVNAEECKRLFEKEIYVWSTLKHANVLPLLGYAFDDDTGYPMLISEWMANGNALAYVKASGPSIERIKEILCDSAQGMKYLHGRGVIHSDIKPENIVINRNGVALLCDFGCARTEIATYSIAALSMTSKGTCNYWAPELLDTEEVVFSAHTSQTDIWAFGMTIYALYTKKAPFHKRNELGVLMALLHGELPHFTSGHSESESNTLLKHICSLCWRRQPSERPDASFIVDELRRASGTSSSRKPGDPDLHPSSVSHESLHIRNKNVNAETSSQSPRESGNEGKLHLDTTEVSGYSTGSSYSPTSPTYMTFPSYSYQDEVRRWREKGSTRQRSKSTITRRNSKLRASPKHYSPEKERDCKVQTSIPAAPLLKPIDLPDSPSISFPDLFPFTSTYDQDKQHVGHQKRFGNQSQSSGSADQDTEEERDSINPTSDTTPSTMARSHFQFCLHQALAFNPQSQHSFQVSSLIHWDIRLPPPTARLSGSPRHSHTGLPPPVLSQHATSPPVTVFCIISGVLPSAWTVEIRNARGVTVGDVLDGLFGSLRRRVSPREWEHAPKSHQVRVAEAWCARCALGNEKHREGRKGERERMNEEEAGVRRVDWLVNSTSFVGLTPSVEKEYTWTLTTKRAEK